ncbi:hypothetical protein GOP47_0015721 [Adiantum capillus-veneris]|uniref:Two-component response regulator-like APRR2 n=1 Tax=Adiantum capillus-veneris TaxID=13818 RepID=A0A9D4UK90_ADICA|nr:hypothetical protein GOP47_0015721 [Adiantum capillus-veneris]
MLALADQFPEWKDFPKGLHVMLVDQDLDVIKDVRHKLDSCGYLVTCYTRGEEALQELEDKSKTFHVVVVDATRNDTFDGFKIVAAAKHLTTIMMASTENMNIMMQGIAAGASEFLQKPLSEERLKNIWQHVVRKALVTGHLVAPTTVAPSANNLKFKATPKPSVCSDVTDGGYEAPAQVKHEDQVFCIYNANKADELSATQQFLFQEESQHHIHSNSSYMDMDGKDNCDAFLCSTPPQLEPSCTRIVLADHDDNPEFVSSPPMSMSQDFNMKRELKDVHEYFEDCDSYLHIKSEVDEAVNNSAILNELFDSKSQMDSGDFLLMADDHQSNGNEEFVDPKLCVDLHFHDIPDSLDDIAIGSDILDDTTDQSLSMGLDCLDDEDFQEADEEALLLAEVAKVEKNMSLDNPCCNVPGSPDDSTCNNNVHSMHQPSSAGTGPAFPENVNKASESQEETRCKSDSEQSCNIKGSKSSSGKKKMKVDWTPELHRRFVQAVEQLGVDKAIPSRILELMGVKCLTRHNIASHLQKYRSHRKHVQAREVEAASWNQRRHIEVAAAGRTTPPATLRPQQATWPTIRPSATAQTQPRAALPAPPPVLHVWGHPTLDPSLHFWPAWPPPACQLDAWGNPFYAAQPILRVPLAPMPSIANMALFPTIGKQPNLHPPKETVVAAINEVLKNPYVPLPLGLKSPSLESVVSELQRQGIPMAPTATI